MSIVTILGTLELGLIYALMALGVFITYRILNMADLTVDSSFTTGAAVSAVFCLHNAPVFGIILSFFAGCAAGCITALLHAKLKIQPILAGILTMLGLYSINLRIMGNKPNISLHREELIFDTGIRPVFICLAVVIVVVILLFLFLKTKMGFAIRATGDNTDMVKSLGISPDISKIIGLAVANGLVAMAGGFIAQYQSFADISMGVGIVVIGLASIIIGEVIFGKRNLLNKIVAVASGSVLYRFIIAFVLQLGLSQTDLKLISAVIVAVALSVPVVKDKFNSKFSKNHNGSLGKNAEDAERN